MLKLPLVKERTKIRVVFASVRAGFLKDVVFLGNFLVFCGLEIATKWTILTYVSPKAPSGVQGSFLPRRVTNCLHISL